MQRRELLKMIGLMTGAAMIGTDFLLTGCRTSTTSIDITPEMVALLDEVAETIIPATDTPGAKAAKVGALMKVMVNDCYNPQQQRVFADGVQQIERACKKETGMTFTQASAEQRVSFLESLEKEAGKQNAENYELDRPRKEELINANARLPLKEHKEFVATPEHYYTMIKQLTLFGFFTSETGMTETLRHVPVPGRYDGALPYNQGDKAWAE